MFSKTQELREKRAALIAQAGQILEAAEKGKREMNESEVKEFDGLHAEAAKTKTVYERIERQLVQEEELATPEKARVGIVPAGKASVEDEAAKAEYRVAFDRYLRYGLPELSPEHRAILQTGYQKIEGAEGRALSVGTTTAGGFTVPEDTSLYSRIETALKQFGGVRANAEVIRSATGAALDIPTSDDTAQTGEIIDENAVHNEQDVVFAQLTLDAYLYSSKRVKVSWQLLQDTAIDIENWLGARLGERLGRIQNTHFTVGTGSAQPNGIVTASTQGAVGTTGQTTSITWEDLVDLYHSVDAAYRSNAKWMMNDLSVAKIKKLKDVTNERPLWSPNLREGEPELLLGKPIVTNNDVVVMAANAKSVLFGDFRKYLIRDVKGITVLRLAERFAEFGQVAFLAFLRTDGDLLDAGTNPVKHYANSAT